MSDLAAAHRIVTARRQAAAEAAPVEGEEQATGLLAMLLSGTGLDPDELLAQAEAMALVHVEFAEGTDRTPQDAAAAAYIEGAAAGALAVLVGLAEMGPE